MSLFNNPLSFCVFFEFCLKYKIMVFLHVSKYGNKELITFMNLNLDETSIKILMLLQENSRISFTEIGKNVGLSSPAVAERVKKLEDQGIISGYTININHDALGLGIMVVMKIDFSGAFTLQEKNVLESIAKFPEIIEYLRVTGTNDCIIKAVVSSVDHMRTLIEELGTFGRIDTSIVTYKFITRNTIDLKNCTANQ